MMSSIIFYGHVLKNSFWIKSFGGITFTQSYTPTQPPRCRRSKLAAPFSARRSRSSCDGTEDGDCGGWCGVANGSLAAHEDRLGWHILPSRERTGFLLLLPNSPKQHSSAQQRAGSLAFSRTSPTHSGSAPIFRERVVGSGDR